jgi:hypothetical protein
MNPLEKAGQVAAYGKAVLRTAHDTLLTCADIIPIPATRGKGGDLIPAGAGIRRETVGCVRAEWRIRQHSQFDQTVASPLTVKCCTATPVTAK